MADDAKKSAKDKPLPKTSSDEMTEEEYELLPHKDIVELREELRRLRSLPPEAGQHAEASFEELSGKMDRLIEVFTEAEKTINVEEGASSFKEKMAPLVEKMNKILEQNSEIAEGIVALADIMNEIKDKLEVGVIYKEKGAEKMKPEPEEEEEPMPIGPRPMGPMPPPGMPPMMGPGMPPPLPRPGAPMPQMGPRPGPMPPPPMGGMPPPPGGMPPPPGAAQKKKGLFGR